MAKKVKKTPTGVKVERKVECKCKGDCKYKSNRNLNDMNMDFCTEYLHVLSYTKIK